MAGSAAVEFVEADGSVGEFRSLFTAVGESLLPPLRIRIPEPSQDGGACPPGRTPLGGISRPPETRPRLHGRREACGQCLGARACAPRCASRTDTGAVRHRRNAARRRRLHGRAGHVPRRPRRADRTVRSRRARRARVRRPRSIACAGLPSGGRYSPCGCRGPICGVAALVERHVRREDDEVGLRCLVGRRTEEAGNVGACLEACAEVLRWRVRTIGPNPGPCAPRPSVRIVPPVARQLLHGRLYRGSRAGVSEVDDLYPVHGDWEDGVLSQSRRQRPRQMGGSDERLHLEKRSGGIRSQVDEMPGRRNRAESAHRRPGAKWSPRVGDWDRPVPRALREGDRRQACHACWIQEKTPCSSAPMNRSMN